MAVKQWGAAETIKLLDNEGVIVPVRLLESNTAAENTALLVAAESALPIAGGMILLPHGEFDYNGFRVTKDNVILQGAGRKATILVLKGVNVGFGNADSTNLRSRCGLRDLEINGQTADFGATMLELDNMTKCRFRDVYLNATTTPGITGVEFIGGTVGGHAGRSTYFNEFYGVDITSDVACWKMGNWCNRQRVYGGVWEGEGYLIDAQPTDGETTDTCMFFGVSFQTDNAVGMRLGDGTTSVAYFTFEGCTSEPVSATQEIQIAANCPLNTFIGGSYSRTTWADVAANNTTLLIPANQMLQIGNQNQGLPKRTIDLRAPLAGITLADDDEVNLYSRTTGILSSDADTLEVKGGIVTGYGSGAEFRTAGTAFYAWGSTNLPLYIDSKGNGAIQLNVQNGATGGTLIEASGGKFGVRGATPVITPTVTGSRGGNAALASLLTQLALQGIIVDSTS